MARVEFGVNAVFGKPIVAIYVIGRAKTRELEKFADKVGLIEVSTIQGKVVQLGGGSHQELTATHSLNLKMRNGVNSLR
jgi:hypothetical protein